MFQLRISLVSHSLQKITRTSTLEYELDCDKKLEHQHRYKDFIWSQRKLVSIWRRKLEMRRLAKIEAFIIEAQAQLRAVRFVYLSFSDLCAIDRHEHTTHR